jgi:hypothetical protein
MGSIVAGQTDLALVPIKTSAGTGYCDCICGCYELVSLRDDVTGKSFCPRCSKEHLELNTGIGLSRPAPSHLPEPSPSGPATEMPAAADPPGRLR